MYKLSISNCLLFSALAIAAFRTFRTVYEIRLFENLSWFTALLAFLLTIDLAIFASLAALAAPVHWGSHRFAGRYYFMGCADNRLARCISTRLFTFS